MASADKPFRFPATFTFVVRSFTVLDGIGKGLDPRFDISEIAAPYARSLLLEASPQFAKLQSEFGKRLRLQVWVLAFPSLVITGMPQLATACHDPPGIFTKQDLQNPGRQQRGAMRVQPEQSMV